MSDMPFIKHLGIRAESPSGDGGLTLSHNAKLGDGVGALHAGALMALAEAASAEALTRAVASVGGAQTSIRRFESVFKKPVHGRVTAKANLDQAEVDRMIVELSADGRAIFSVPVTVRREDGETCMVAEVEWVVAMRMAAARA